MSDDALSGRDACNGPICGKSASQNVPRWWRVAACLMLLLLAKHLASERWLHAAADWNIRYNNLFKAYGPSRTDETDEPAGPAQGGGSAPIRPEVKFLVRKASLAAS